MEIPTLEEKARELRRDILRMTNRAKHGHVGGSLSEIDILAVLYGNILNLDPCDPDKPDRDRFILSKGHATPGYYAALADAGFFDKRDLDRFDQLDSPLQAHPDMRKCPGVDYSTGSLGQGLSIGVGIAMGAELLGQRLSTFVLLGDGESQEGQVWEALMFAGARRVNRLVAIFDNNGVQLSSSLRENIDIAPLREKLAAFRWSVLEADGHDVAELDRVLRAAKEQAAEGPVAVIAHTVKGKGVGFMEHRFQWHGKAPDDNELAAALLELEGNGNGGREA